MQSIHPQFIIDTAGKKLVVLPLKEFDTLLDQIEELEDIKSYDKAKKEDSGYRISLDEYNAKRGFVK